MPLDLNDNIIKNVRVLILKKEGGKMFFLLTQEFYGGYYTLPGGCKDAEDADLRAALHRELREELGLDPEDYTITDAHIQKEYANLYDFPPERAGKKTAVSLFIVSGLKKEPAPSAEIKGVVWLTAEEAIGAFNVSHMKELFQMALNKIT